MEIALYAAVFMVSLYVLMTWISCGLIVISTILKSIVVITFVTILMIIITIRILI